MGGIKLITFVVVAVFFGFATSDWSPPSESDLARRQCEPVSIAMCRNVGYNETGMPNQFHHATQHEAGLIVHQFWPLVEISCSPYLRFFLCSMYVPICLRDYIRPLPPCKSVCEHARNGCEPLMRDYGFKWPEDLNCDRLPESGKDNPENLCMEPPAISSQSTTTTQKTTTELATTRKPEQGKTPTWSLFVPDKHGLDRGKGSGKDKDRQSVWQQFKVEHREHGSQFDVHGFDHSTLVACQCQCQAPFVIAPEFPDSKIARNLTHCAQPCKSAYIDEQKLDLIKILLTFWAVCCFLASLATCLTFLIDMDRFHYPERPIFCLTFCYLLVSAGYLLRYVAGHETVSCMGNTARQGPVQFDICLAVFLLTYYFGMASAVWWVILSFTWFLAAGLKWSHEAITSYWVYFHLCAWGVPLVQTSLALGVHAVDGDPHTGLCGLGNTRVDMLRVFELGPLVAYVLLGSAFLAAGFASLVRIRHIVKAQHHHHAHHVAQQHKQPLCTPYHQQYNMSPLIDPGMGGIASPVGRLEQLMLKLGGFALLYALPTGVRIFALFWEQHFRTSWEISLVCRCAVAGLDNAPSFPSQQLISTPAPLAVTLCKHGSSLCVGIAGALWVASGKTLRSWLAILCCQSGGPIGVEGGAKRRPDSNNSRYATTRYEPAEAIIIKSHTDVSSAAPAGNTPNMRQHANGAPNYQHMVPHQNFGAGARENGVLQANRGHARMPQQHMVFTPQHNFTPSAVM